MSFRLFLINSVLSISSKSSNGINSEYSDDKFVFKIFSSVVVVIRIKVFVKSANWMIQLISFSLSYSSKLSKINKKLNLYALFLDIISRYF